MGNDNFYQHYKDQEQQQREQYKESFAHAEEHAKEHAYAEGHGGNTRHCPRCGAPVEEGMRFCEECGCAVDEYQCPHCHQTIPPGMALCPHCGRPVNLSRCSFCGAAKEPDEPFCSECGNPTQGIVCPICGTLNYRSFCRQCNHPLNERALQAVMDAHNDPRMQEVQQLAEQLEEMETLIHQAHELAKEASDDSADDGNGNIGDAAPDTGESLTEADRKLLDNYKSLYAELGINYTHKPSPAPKPSPGNGNTATRQTVAERQKQLLHGATLQEKMEEFKRKMEEMKAKMNAMQPDPSATPETQRDFICARKVTVKSMSKNVWICNWCHCQHNDPSECYREDLGGEWTYSYRYHDVEIIS